MTNLNVQLNAAPAKLFIKPNPAATDLENEFQSAACAINIDMREPQKILYVRSFSNKLEPTIEFDSCRGYVMDYCLDASKIERMFNSLKQQDVTIELIVIDAPILSSTDDLESLAKTLDVAMIIKPRINLADAVSKQKKLTAKAFYLCWLLACWSILIDHGNSITLVIASVISFISALFISAKWLELQTALEKENNGR